MCSFARHTAQTDMETLLLLFPQFSFCAPEAGSALQNAESRSLAADAEDEARQQRVGSFRSDLEAMVASTRLLVF